MGYRSVTPIRGPGVEPGREPLERAGFARSFVYRCSDRERYLTADLNYLEMTTIELLIWITLK